MAISDKKTGETTTTTTTIVSPPKRIRTKRTDMFLYFMIAVGCFGLATMIWHHNHLLGDRSLSHPGLQAFTTTSSAQKANRAVRLSLEKQQQQQEAPTANQNKKEQQVQEQLLQQLQDGMTSDAHQPQHSALVDSRLAGLQCDRHGGPDLESAREMVYWEDIPSDSHYRSPFYSADQYLTFEPDAGGWNNIRMAMETVLSMSFAMGRTLVLPPRAGMYLLNKGGSQFTFDDFFHMETIAQEHVGLNIISMQEFLETVALKGKLLHYQTKQVAFPPKNRTNWDGEPRPIFEWLRQTVHVAEWVPEDCLAVFPNSNLESDVAQLREMEQIIQKNPPKFEEFVDKPVPLDAPTLDRMRENWAGRKRLCLYDSSWQQSSVVHFPVGKKARLLVHFYAFVFFQNYKTDLWMKRFIRDHVRYTDGIQCAAARVVARVREHSRQAGHANGAFDAFHVRRGDFQYKATRVSAETLLKQAQRKLQNGTTLFIATDERDKTFFNPLKTQYDVVFLDDFMEELSGVNKNFFGMIDALVTTRSDTFFGCWFSTFTGYINRIRGYHADEEEHPGYKEGHVNSWYYALPDRFDHMQHYYPVKQSYYAREFPTSWRLIDSTFETS